MVFVYNHLFGIVVHNNYKCKWSETLALLQRRWELHIHLSCLLHMADLDATMFI